jgi:large subunit ribosomal protein L30
MILVIRISGMVDVNEDIENALNRLRLRRKYCAVLIQETKSNLTVLKKLRNHVAFGTIDKDTLKELVEKRAQPLTVKGKIDAEKVISHIEKKKPSEWGIKPFFRLHPPRGGIESKKHAGVGKGVLGDNKEKINDLVRRML